MEPGSDQLLSLHFKLPTYGTIGPTEPLNHPDPLNPMDTTAPEPEALEPMTFSSSGIYSHSRTRYRCDSGW